jgi:predicted nucleotidyltransferase
MTLEVQNFLPTGTTKPVNQKVLREIIRRIVETAHPERIILFGSAARGKMGPNSDVDLLVVKGGKFDQGRLTGDIYENLYGVGQAVDVIVVTPEQVERHRNKPWLVIAPALREGREVYHS